MASLHDGTIENQAERDLQTIRTRLLRNYEFSRSTSLPSQSRSCNGSAVCTPLQLSKTPELSFNVPQPVRAHAALGSSLRPLPAKNTPHFRISASVACNMDNTVGSTTSQEAFYSLTQAKSFHPGYLSANDTQSMSSQVYENLRQSMINPVACTPFKISVAEDFGSQRDISPASSGRSRTQGTVREGETGHIDLVGGWREPSSPVGSTKDYDELLEREQDTESPEVQFKIPSRQLPPETPAMAGKKRGRDGEPLTSTTKTPRFSQVFGHRSTAILTNSQLFQQTQARSSPGLDFPHSDPAGTRPSPNIEPSTTTSSQPTPHCFSSPIATAHARPSSAGDEPKATHVSILESEQQKAAKRKALLEFERAERALDSNSDEDEDEDGDQSRKLHSVRSKTQVDVHGNMMEASSRSYSHGTLRTNIDLTTPATAGSVRRLDFEVVAEHEWEEEPENPEKRKEVDEDEGLQETDRLVHEDEEHFGMEQSNADDEYNDLRVSLRSANDIGEEVKGVKPDDAFANSGQIADLPIPTQYSAVADSQPTVQDGDGDRRACRYTQKSSNTSRVSGSQNGGKTAVDQATCVYSPWASQSKRNNIDQRATTCSRKVSKLPSSPPVLRTEESLPGESAQDTPEKRSMQGQQPPKIQSMQPTIPESDFAERDIEYAQPGIRQTGRAKSQDISAPYSTAKTHVTASTQSPAPRFPVDSSANYVASQQSTLAEPSPRKQAGVPHFAEIRGISRSNSSFGVEVDAIMDGIMTNEDQMVLAALSDTSVQRTKRRKFNRRACPNTRSPKNSSTPPTLREQPTNRSAQNGVSNSMNSTVPDSEPDLVTAMTVPSVLEDGTSKGNELPEVKARGTLDESRSPRFRGVDCEGNVESPLVAARQAQHVQNMRPNVHGRALEKKVAAAARKKRKSSTTTATKDTTESKPDRDDAVSYEVPTEASLRAAYETPQTPDMASPTSKNKPSPIRIGTRAVLPVQDHELPSGPIVAANRILAYFGGRYPNFYTATWLGGSADGLTHRVQFDDGTISDVNTNQVRSLEFRLGDIVKEDMDGSRNHTWRIIGFGAKAATEEGHGMVDIYGHMRVKVQTNDAWKKGSITNESTTVALESAIIREIPINQIYVTSGMLQQYKGRVFDPPTASRSGTSACSETSTTGPYTPADETPSVSSRASTRPVKKFKGISGRASDLRDRLATSTTTVSSAAIFSGMAFAVSYVFMETEKADVMSKIMKNGGVVLKKGFEELFALEDSPDDQAKSMNAIERLQLKASTGNLGFVALIADRHSRTAKYMQALALGLPTLSGRWIIDSLDACKNAALNSADVVPLPWDKYLLPAGESSYLGGAIRSRTMPLYEAATAVLADTVACRPLLLLSGEGVLVVSSKEATVGWEKRRTYAFLTLALGASRFQRVDDLQTAKDIIQQEPDTAKWIYVDGSVSEAENVLFAKDPTGKKRKRESGTASAFRTKTTRNVRVVNDEFVMQSLILGALVD